MIPWAIGLAAMLAACLPFASGASAHPGGPLVNRFSAQMEVRSIMSDNYGWYVSNVTCGGSSWIVGRHFPCSFTRLGRSYLVCYHSIDYNYGIVTAYNRYSCNQY